MENQREELIERLEKWQHNATVGMTKEKYLDMKDQLGEPPDWEECPPGGDDFPEIVTQAINTFSGLGDRIYPDIGYVGKDYTNLPIYLKWYGVEDEQFFLELLLHLDHEAIKTSQDNLKREMDRLKRKHG